MLLKFQQQQKSIINLKQKNMKRVYLLVAAIAITGITKAAVVYTDVADLTLGATASLDINFDGTGGAEFSFSNQAFSGPVSPGVFFNPDAGFIMVSANEWDVIKGVSLNTVINTSSSFLNNGTDGYIAPGWETTMFPNGADTYIGATFKLGGNVHYGWIRVNWNVNGTFVVKDFAYENTPNMAINAGDMGTVTGIKTIENQLSLTVYPNPTTDFIQVELPLENASNTTINIIDINGKIVKSSVVSGQTKIDVSTLISGKYFVFINNKEQVYSTSFIKN